MAQAFTKPKDREQLAFEFHFFSKIDLECRLEYVAKRFPVIDWFRIKGKENYLGMGGFNRLKMSVSIETETRPWFSMLRKCWDHPFETIRQRMTETCQNWPRPTKTFAHVLRLTKTWRKWPRTHDLKPCQYFPNMSLPFTSWDFLKVTVNC